MASTPAQHQARIDALMEQASQQLVRRRYFEAEAACLEALRKAVAIRDFDRIARITLPLQEARRQKRDMAVEAGDVFIVDSEIPSGKKLVPGCYLVSPPRVGVDGRALREAADKKHVPIVVTVREPATREGLWPVVAVGPVTIRVKVKPPLVAAAPRPRAKTPKKSAKPAKTAPSAPEPSERSVPALPPSEWFIYANEQLGDAAIAEVGDGAQPASRVGALIEYLEAHPDHEKLHQRLEEAARAAARDPRPPRRGPATPIDDEDAGDDEGDDLD